MNDGEIFVLSARGVGDYSPLLWDKPGVPRDRDLMICKFRRQDIAKLLLLLLLLNLQAK